jgi:hypothetical protein
MFGDEVLFSHGICEEPNKEFGLGLGIDQFVEGVVEEINA